MNSALHFAPVFIVPDGYWRDLFNLTAIMLLALVPLILGLWKGGDDQ